MDERIIRIDPRFLVILQEQSGAWEKVGGIHFLSLRLGFDGGARALLFSLVGLRRGWRGTVDLDGSVDNSKGDVKALNGLFEVVYGAGVILRETRYEDALVWSPPSAVL